MISKIREIPMRKRVHKVAITNARFMAVSYPTREIVAATEKPVTAGVTRMRPNNIPVNESEMPRLIKKSGIRTCVIP